MSNGVDNRVFIRIHGLAVSLGFGVVGEIILGLVVSMRRGGTARHAMKFRQQSSFLQAARGKQQCKFGD